ncbi:hypothetical protein PCC7424_4363 [Gloeothece citriformis PCC 7424]|uniref:Uncharacterized protein n=1 Tax=Gloeothece citriformis (strain PCC 7424) TaxID=65393 RepID=B7K8W0_GLOC7|nr:hypothetical protein [Gloeothece citriformis]ACK72729.1 hypothetical protein PCC7424_4363 [Gloeothece citriformis PCC 7424]
MKRVFSVLGFCLCSAVINGGTLDGSAFAQTTPSPSTFKLPPYRHQEVILNPEIPSFTVVYNNSDVLSALIKFKGGECIEKIEQILRETVDHSVTYNCGFTKRIMFFNNGSAEVNIQVSQ